MPLYIANVSVAMLVALALSSLGVYGVLMAGWASNSKYALLSGMRASAQVLSYELTFGISLVGVFLMSGSLSLVDITNAQNVSHAAGQPGIWFVLLQPVALLIFFTSALAEPAGTPFDLIEAESELVSGYHTEYSGMRFGLFQLAEFNAVFTMSLACHCPLSWAAGALPWAHSSTAACRWRASLSSVACSAQAFHLDVHQGFPADLRLLLAALDASALPLRPVDGPLLESLPALILAQHTHHRTILKLIFFPPPAAGVP